MKITNILILVLLVSQVLIADIAGNFTLIDIVRQTSIDPLTGREVISFTNSSNITIPQPDRNVWVESDNFVVFETDIARPSGSSSGIGEKQLTAINVETGSCHWIAPLEVENPFIYGWGHFDMPSDSHFACSRENDLVAYRDITGHHLYLKRLSDDTTIELLHMFTGTFINEPAISDDGSVVIIEVIHRGPETDYHDGTNHSVILFNIDVINMQVVNIEVPQSFPNRKVNAVQLAEKLGKPILSTDGSWIAFKNIQNNLKGEENYSLTYCMSDGSRLGKFVENIEDVRGLWCSGNDLYFVADGGFSRANINSTGYQKWRKILIDKSIKVKGKAKKPDSKMIPLPVYTVEMENISLLSNGAIVYNTLPISYNAEGLGSTIIYKLNTITTDKKRLISARQGNDSSKKNNFHISGDEKRIVYTDFEVSGSKLSMFVLE